ncbi:hypothetical protein V1T75_11620 [Tenacibaculum sp. FZY0031]|uniref:hypothetical protein n=1 Tax=Tenacibaculum sp. FZY0031 TaxID=3116648 RepID=UPI002E9A0087|nr:hypothetical protein [Tenacibaculum sp. FZY0031]
MSVILKKGEKIENVISTLEEGYSFQMFMEKFIETYPSDWEKINSNYNKHLRKNKEGKSFPMPKPEQYLKNMLNVWQKKQ